MFFLYCRERISREAGVKEIVLRGGYSRSTSLRSELRMNSIVATTAISKSAGQWVGRPMLSNARLFRRDDCMCTRDHAISILAEGQDTCTRSGTPTKQTLKYIKSIN